MTDAQQKTIVEMRKKGQGYRQIAGTLGISVNTIKSFCRRNTIIRDTTSKDNQIEDRKGTCRQCGVMLRREPNTRARVFCSGECRIQWWSKNRSQSAGASTVKKRCEQCGHVFRSQISAKRKYCSQSCFFAMKGAAL